MSQRSPPSSLTPKRHKLVLLGESSVGKSSIVLRMVRHEWTENQHPTIGASFFKLTVPGDQPVHLDIWDTAGQERYRSLASMYYRGASAAIVVYDLTSAESFERAKFWIKELLANGNGDIVIGLTGNKLDLAAERRKVPLEVAKKYAEETDIILHETSAKTGENINLLLEDMVAKLRKLAAFQVGQGAPSAGPSGAQGGLLNNQAPNEKSGGKGCC